MIEQLIAEATEFDFKVALKTNPPKNRLKNTPLLFQRGL